MQITLANLKDATAQQVFDQVKTHLLAQNKKSSNETGGCFYRSGDLKCAAGCLIADKEYNPDMDSMEQGTSWADLVSHNLAPPEHARLISRLQNVHDDFNPSDWHDQLQRVAINHNLVFNV